MAEKCLAFDEAVNCFQETKRLKFDHRKIFSQNKHFVIAWIIELFMTVLLDLEIHKCSSSNVAVKAWLDLATLLLANIVSLSCIGIPATH
jgi:hypothetical protein